MLIFLKHKMKLKSFFKLVEIQTKVASVLPAIYGLMYAVYLYGHFNPLNTVLFFIALLSIDMATTAINNLMDHRRARLRHGYGFTEHNAIVKDGLSLSYVYRCIIGLLLTAAAFGLWLVYLTDVWILIIGLCSVGVGILYSLGPIPLSHTPLGELASGLMMGLGIFFVSVYIQLPAPAFFNAMYNQGILTLYFDLYQITSVIYWSIPFVLGIAGIMLANNISDYQEDGANHRITLPQVIGVKKSLTLLKCLYGAALLHLFGLIAMGGLPLYGLLLVLICLPITRKLKMFILNPDKATTFILMVQSYIVLALGHILVLGLAILIQ